MKIKVTLETLRALTEGDAEQRRRERDRAAWGVGSNRWVDAMRRGVPRGVVGLASDLGDEEATKALGDDIFPGTADFIMASHTVREPWFREVTASAVHAALLQLLQDPEWARRLGARGAAELVKILRVGVPNKSRAVHVRSVLDDLEDRSANIRRRLERRSNEISNVDMQHFWALTWAFRTGLRYLEGDATPDAFWVNLLKLPGFTTDTTRDINMAAIRSFAKV